MDEMVWIPSKNASHGVRTVVEHHSETYSMMEQVMLIRLLASPRGDAHWYGRKLTRNEESCNENHRGPSDL
jgi:hypothetical protein